MGDEEQNLSFQFTLNNLKSVAIGALINLAGSVLLAIGLFLQSTKFTQEDWRVLGYALLANLGAVIVNTVRKFVSNQ